MLDPKGIWNFKQNKPSLVANDLEILGIERNTTYEILLKRGVFKWLAARRDIIKLKNTWRDRITQTIVQIRTAKAEHDKYRHYYLKGYLKAIEECRGEVRQICHSERWRAPDFDRDAQRYLEIAEVEELTE